MKKRKRNTVNSERVRDASGLASLSLFIFWLDRLADAIYHACANGFFGKLFTAYTFEQEAFERGFLKQHFISSKFKRYFRKVCEFFSKIFENSYFLNEIKYFSSGMLSIPLKSYGVSFFFFGLYTVLICLIRWIVPGLEEVSIDYVWIGISVCVISIPMLISYGSLAEALGKGKITAMIVKDSFGFREEIFEKREQLGRAKSNLLLVFGMLMGLLTVFVHPLAILIGVLTAVVVALIFSAPEVGVLLSIFFLPFFSFFDNPTLVLGTLILIVCVSYLIKLISGKRILKLELLDLAVCLFLILLYFSGVISAGGNAGYDEVLISCILMFGYFLTANLMRTERWLKRCVWALIVSGTVVAIVGILQYLFAMPQMNAWLDTSYFYDIEGRAVSVFDNPNVLASYLVLILPFTLLGMVQAKKRKEKLLYHISVLSVLVCLVLTWSRGAWLAVLVSVLIFALMYSKKTVRFLVFLCGCIPFLTFLLPQSITRRFMSIGDLTDSSSMYRLYTWKGSLRSIREYFMGGVGYGNAAYNEIYPQFAYAGIEAAEHTHSLFLQILFGMGIGGLLIFCTVLFLSAQMNLEYFKNCKKSESRFMVLACICAIAASLVMGIFDFVWYNYRVFFLFWVILALGCACVRVGTAEQKRHSVQADLENDQATLDIEI